MTTSTTEPTELRAGATWTWAKGLSEYPAPTWVLKYWLKNAANHIEITASASGSSHLVLVAASATQTKQAGDYSWIAAVEDGAGLVHQVGSGRVTVLPRVDTANALDTRTNARKVLEELEAAYLSYVQSTGQGASLVQSFTIGDRSTTFHGPADFIEALNYWHGRVADEDARASVASGMGNPRRIGIRLQRG